MGQPWPVPLSNMGNSVLIQAGCQGAFSRDNLVTYSAASCSSAIYSFPFLPNLETLRSLSWKSSADAEFIKQQVTVTSGC